MGSPKFFTRTLYSDSQVFSLKSGGKVLFLHLHLMLPSSSLVIDFSQSVLLSIYSINNLSEQIDKRTDCEKSMTKDEDGNIKCKCKKRLYYQISTKKLGRQITTRL